jgi:hypothetical protein
MTSIRSLRLMCEAAERSYGADAEVLITGDGFNFIPPTLTFSDKFPDAVLLGPSAAVTRADEIKKARETISAPQPPFGGKSF